MNIKETGLYHWSNTYNNVVYKAKKEMSEGKPMSLSRLQSIYDNEVISWNSVIDSAGAWVDRLEDDELAQRIRGCVADFKFREPSVQKASKKPLIIGELLLLIVSVIVGAVSSVIVGAVLLVFGSGIVAGKLSVAMDKDKKAGYEAYFGQMKEYTSKIEAVLSEYDE